MVHVHVLPDDGTLIATSPDAPGWTAVADSIDELLTLAADGLAFYLENDHLELAVTVSELVDVAWTKGGVVVTFGCDEPTLANTNDGRTWGAFAGADLVSPPFMWTAPDVARAGLQNA